MFIPKGGGKFQDQTFFSVGRGIEEKKEDITQRIIWENREV